MKNIRECSVCGKNGTSDNIKFSEDKYYCGRHYSQIKRIGRIIEDDSRWKSRIVPNEIIIHDDYAEIIINDKNKNEICRGIISLEDIELVKERRWSYSSSVGYIVCIIKDKITTLHRYVLGAKTPDLLVDHINRNKLDCRKENLRFCTIQENLKNQSKREKCTSKYIGVSYSKDRGKWVAQISVANKNINLGRFATEKEAVICRMKAEEKYYKNYKSSHNMNLFTDGNSNLDFLLAEKD